MRRLSASLLLSLSLLVATAQTTVRCPSRIPPLLEECSWGMSVRDVSTGVETVGIRSQQLLTPASTMKILSTATALERLGGDTRIPTKVYLTGPVEGGVLKGDLLLVGHGDPTIESGYLPKEQRWRFYDEVSDAVRRAGIRTIRGAVMALSDRRDFQAVNPYWIAADMGNYYAAGHFMLNVLDNTYYVRFGDYGRSFTVTPEVPGLKLVDCYSRSGSVSADSLYISPFLLSDGSLAVTGLYPSGVRSLSIRGAVPDPPLLLASRLANRLRKDGVTVVGGFATCDRMPEETELICTYLSPTLREIVRLTNHFSVNLFAEACLRLLGERSASLPGETLTQTAIRVVKRHWASRGLLLTQLEMRDGSGLALSDKISPALLTALLAKLQDNPAGRELGQLLPQIGREGTLRLLLRGTRLEGAGRMKSGTLHGVTCYAGYITRDGRTYAVAVMVNNHLHRASKVRKAIGDLLLDTFPGD